MKVWAVRESMDYDYNDVHSLWDSFEKADRVRAELRADDPSEYTEYEVREMEVN